MFNLKFLTHVCDSIWRLLTHDRQYLDSLADHEPAATPNQLRGPLVLMSGPAFASLWLRLVFPTAL